MCIGCRRGWPLRGMWPPARNAHWAQAELAIKRHRLHATCIEQAAPSIKRHVAACTQRALSRRGWPLRGMWPMHATCIGCRRSWPLKGTWLPARNARWVEAEQATKEPGRYSGDPVAWWAHITQLVWPMWPLIQSHMVTTELKI